jgi:hypothetical protein
MEFAIDKLALAQVFLRVLLVSMSISFHCDSPYSHIIGPLVDSLSVQRLTGGLRPIDLKNNVTKLTFMSVSKFRPGTKINLNQLSWTLGHNNTFSYLE